MRVRKVPTAAALRVRVPEHIPKRIVMRSPKQETADMAATDLDVSIDLSTYERFQQCYLQMKVPKIGTA